MKKLKSIRLAALAAAFVPVLFAGCSVVRIAPHAKLEVMDPTWTTAYVTRNHGYLVYDTLFALDETYEPRPQMVERWTVSPDQKTWTFTLRDGLKWHDGTPVTAEDCVASLRRWGRNDGAGQQLFRQVDGLAATDARTFTLQLRAPQPQLLHTFAKMSGIVAFMLPKRIAEADPATPITEPVGSGPYKYSRFWSVPWANKVAYVKNRDYVGRGEPLSLAAGDKSGKADRIEWIYYPTQAEAARALVDAQVDYVESPSFREVPMLQKARRVVVATTDPLGNVGMARFNMLQPPFDKAAVRRAAVMAMQQEDYMKAALGTDGNYWRTCYSIYPCGTPLSTTAGADAMKGGSVQKAREALAAAGYDGSPVVLLNPVDSPVISAFTQVTADKLRAIGMNVQVQDMDWSTLLRRRANRGPVSEGGWSMFHTWWLAGDLMDPSAIAFSGDPQTGWTGWLKDDELEAARAAFATAATPEQRKAIAERVQQRVLDDAPFAVLGQFFEPVAFAKNVKGITSPIQFYWQLHR